MKSVKPASVAIASCLSIAALTMPAFATGLFVKVGPTNSNGRNTCLSFARDAAHDEHLQNVQLKNGLVSGVMGDKSVVMVCVGTTVIISVAAERQDEVAPLAEGLIKHISDMHGL
jgi:hypothetical protein